MQKLIAVPVARYNNLVEKEKAQSGLKETVNATMKNLENEELLQRQRHYKDMNEEMPEAHNQSLKQRAVTYIPPPPLKNIREFKERQKAHWEKIFPTTKTFKPNKPRVRKPAAKKPTVPAKNSQFSFNLLDPKSFSKLKAP